MVDVCLKHVFRGRRGGCGKPHSHLGEVRFEQAVTGIEKQTVSPFASARGPSPALSHQACGRAIVGEEQHLPISCSQRHCLLLMDAPPPAAALPAHDRKH